MLLAQRVHLRSTQAGVAEHAALAEQVAKVMPRHQRRQPVVQRMAHRGDALAHGGQLGLPQGAQIGIAQHMGHDLGGVDAGAGVDPPHREAQLTQHQRRLSGRGADRAERTAALAVHAHALGKRVGDEKRQAGAGQGPHGIGVGVDAVAKALVGQVQVGQQLALAQYRDQRVPLGRAQVHAGRVVATGVQQHDAACRYRPQRGQHRVKTQATGGRIVIRVGVDDKTTALEHRPVVVPGRVADPDLGAR